MDHPAGTSDAGVHLKNITTDNSQNVHLENPAFYLELDSDQADYTGMNLEDGSEQRNGVSLKIALDSNRLSIPRRRHSTSDRRNMMVTFDGGGPPRPVSCSTLSGMKLEDDFDELNVVTLIYSRHERVPMKDFSQEVRATMDIQRFLNNAVLLLDLNKTGMDGIIDKLLRKMLTGNADLPLSLDQAKAALFTQDNVHQLRRTLQCTSVSEGGGFDFDQNWICAMCSVPAVQTSFVGIARLRHAANLGMTCQEIHFVIVVIAPTKEKGTKSDFEISRTFATIFSDLDFRQELYNAANEEQFKRLLEKHAAELSMKENQVKKMTMNENFFQKEKCHCGFMKGIRGDLKRRLPHYLSDFKDGIFGHKTLHKTISAMFFLYFACILPSIAFGVLNSDNTNGLLGVEKVLYSQTFGGLFFAIFGGTPHIILLTTAPLALYTKIIFSISQDFGLNFPAMYACVGLWNCFFMFLYSIFDLSILMQWSTRSSEEIFALFISIAFSVDAFKNAASNFDRFYNSPACNINLSDSTTNVSLATNASAAAEEVCSNEISILYLFLLFGTLWLGVTLYNFKKTPYLNASRREMLADYSLPVAVIFMSFLGAYVFQGVNIGLSFSPERNENIFRIVPLHLLSVGAIFGAMGLGFCLSLLFFMDQNISAAMVNAPQNKLKKGTSYHWDLFVVGIINLVLSLFAFPWVHAALPHSPLHLWALADVEERVDQGHIYRIIVRVRETRLTALFSHVLIGLSLLVLFVLAFIPTPVLYGLFLYVAVTALFGNQMFERIMLLFTEQAAYPPNHYIRRVPQRKIHIFTLLQLIQLLILCVFGFVPYYYLKMFFPVLIFLLIPIRHKIIPLLIEQKYLNALDGNLGS